MEVVRSRSVKSFLDKITPLRGVSSDTLFQEYVFRGQGNSKWELLPSAFRPGVEFPVDGDIRKGTQRTYRQQREVEWSALRDFILEINRNGFHIADDKLLLRLIDVIESVEEYNLITRFEKPWPNKEYYSLLALAQHFRLPTRLMDWSYNPLVAAYFAAKGCVEQLESGRKVSNLSVYALNKKSSLLESPSETKSFDICNSRNHSHEPIITYHTIDAPTYFNKNLLAQRGLFVCCTEYGLIKNNRFKPLSLSDYLRKRIDKRNKDKNKESLLGGLSEILDRADGVSLYEFTLPANLSFQLLHELDKQFINASTIFPGLSSCVETLYERCAE